MRVLHLFDGGFATHEHALRTRLEMGLADEGVRVFTALPEDRAEHAIGSDLFCTSLFYGRPGPFTTRKTRAAALISGLVDRAPPGSGERAVDVVHAFGGLVWEMALEVGRQSGAAVVCEVWRSGLVGRAKALRAVTDHGVPVALAVPAEALGRELVDVRDVPVRVTPWGVSTSASPRTRDARTRSLMVAATGRDPVRLRACLEAVAACFARDEQMLGFLDVAASDRSDAWKWLDELGLADRVSIVGSFSESRDLVLRGSVLLVPEALGEYRSLLLDAMAAGMPIVAAADPRVAWLRDRETAWLVEGLSAEQWVEPLERLARDPEGASGLVASARGYVAREHRMSGHVAGVLGLYEWLTAEPAIPFKGQPGG